MKKQALRKLLREHDIDDLDDAADGLIRSDMEHAILIRSYDEKKREREREKEKKDRNRKALRELKRGVHDERISDST